MTVRWTQKEDGYGQKSKVGVIRIRAKDTHVGGVWKRTRTSKERRIQEKGERKWDQIEGGREKDEAVGV